MAIKLSSSSSSSTNDTYVFPFYLHQPDLSHLSNSYISRSKSIVRAIKNQFVNRNINSRIDREHGAAIRMGCSSAYRFTLLAIIPIERGSCCWRANSVLTCPWSLCTVYRGRSGTLEERADPSCALITRLRSNIMITRHPCQLTIPGVMTIAGRSKWLTSIV